jgi:very-short-patch-repair endonuclease
MKALTYEHVKNFFKEQNCELLSTEYDNAHYVMKYKCICGNISQISYNNLKKGRRCSDCKGGVRLNFEDVKVYFQEQGCELLSTEYINSQTLMKYKCNCGNISETSYAPFKKGHRCSRCGGNEKSSYEYVKKYFQEQECELLEVEYINSHTPMKYKCICGNISKINFSHFKNCNQRCSKCKHKTEKIVYEFLEKNYTNIIQQAKFEWCKNKLYLPFDFLLDNEKILLEIDGRQHFIQVSNWTSPEYSQKRDIFKMKLALKNGYSIIRISQVDIFNNTIEWESLLKQHIKKYKIPICIYISKNINLYNDYKEKMNLI